MSGFSWIPVKEALPKVGEEVLITWMFESGLKDVTTDSVLKDGRWFRADCLGVKVTAWAPFPEPYEEGSNDDGN